LHEVDLTPSLVALQRVLLSPCVVLLDRKELATCLSPASSGLSTAENKRKQEIIAFIQHVNAINLAVCCDVDGMHHGIQ